jgi:hypothetical protein
MAPFTPEKARELALQDWQTQSARHLGVGLIDISRPRFHWGELFYTESVSEEYSDEADLFCRTYNNTIRCLLAKYGVPTWAPVKRLPDALSCLEMLAEESQPFAEYHPMSQQEESEVRRILFHWGSARPVVILRLFTSTLLLLGGNLADQSGRIEVLDILHRAQWLASFTFPREEVPRFPWEEAARSRSSTPVILEEA